jgi:hypothetical protein
MSGKLPLGFDAFGYSMMLTKSWQCHGISGKLCGGGSGITREGIHHLMSCGFRFFSCVGLTSEGYYT